MLDFAFPSPEGMEASNLFWIFMCYAYVLFTAANLLSDGSELLLFIPSVAGLVGSIVLPVLGAVPDGMMVLFSGMGPVEKAQESVAVGVGALAGSTIMLLTIPWFLAVLGGRVDIENGKPQYTADDKLTRTGVVETLLHTGIGYKGEIRANAKIMFITSLTYLVIQLPALLTDDQNGGHVLLDEIQRENKKESSWALVAMVVCAIEFFVYLYMQYAASLPQSATTKTSSADVLKAKVSGFMGWVKEKLAGAGIAPAPSRGYASSIMKAQELGIRLWMADFRKDWKLDKDKAQNRALLDKNEFPKEFKDTLSMWYKKYTSADTGRITVTDFDSLLRDLGLDGAEDATQLFSKVDANNDGNVDLEEFTECFKILASLTPGARKSRKTTVKAPPPTDEEEDEDEEEEDMPEEFQHLTLEEQRRQIIMKSCSKMGFGTLLVLVFSDPMVDVLGEIGKQSGIPAFYISFILAPLASNSSELVAAYNYAQKKTSKTITISLSTLEGAACMNNTFCLGIFMALVYFQGLAWKFTAETISILVVQLVMAMVVLSDNKQRLLHGLLVLGLFPGALALVYCLENYAGLD